MSVIFSSELGPLIVANDGIIRSEGLDEFDLLGSHLGIGGGLGLPENLPSDGEVLALLPGEVSFDELAVGAAVVVDTVCQVLADVDFPVWVCDFIDNLHDCVLSEFRAKGYHIPLQEQSRMTIPDYQNFMLPVLRSAMSGKVKISDVIAQLADKCSLGSANRDHWAKTYLKQAVLIAPTRRGTLPPHRAGREAWLPVSA
jgi:hypothetical protein